MKKIFMYIITLIFILNSFIIISAAATIPESDAVTASQTMDIGIITGVIALTVSVIVIYLLKHNRRR